MKTKNEVKYGTNSVFPKRDYEQAKKHAKNNKEVELLVDFITLHKEGHADEYIKSLIRIAQKV